MITNEAGRERTMIALAFYAGLREGEIFSRKYRDIDYENYQIDVSDQYTRGELKEPKNKAGKAKMLVCAELIRILKEWQVESKNTKPNDYLFPSPRYPDKPIEYSGWRKNYLQPFLDKYGLSLTLRDFRQLHDRFMRKATNDIDVISKQMRHGDIRTTMQYYHSIEDEIVREALNNLDDNIRSLKNLGSNKKQA
jgi:integrase